MPLKPRYTAPTVRAQAGTGSLAGERELGANVEGYMSSITLVDVIVVALVYAGLSLACAAISRLLSAFRRNDRYVTREPWHTC
jgi:hypothetical protein